MKKIGDTTLISIINFRLILSFTTGFVFLSACVQTKNFYVSPAFQNISTREIAVLPFANQTNDLSAQDILRKMVIEEFKQSGYIPVSVDMVEEKLRNIGITDGGQLPAVAPETVSKTVGTDLLCYGTVEDFTFQNVGFVVKKKVTLNIKIMSGTSKEVLFEAAGTGNDLKIYTKKDEAKKAFVRETAFKLVQNILKFPLRRESEIAIRKIFSKIPRR
ncbi:MAG: GNA1162 family protein [Elusimicrobiota bacterium]